MRRNTRKTQEKMKMSEMRNIKISMNYSIMMIMMTMRILISTSMKCHSFLMNSLTNIIYSLNHQEKMKWTTIMEFRPESPCQDICLHHLIHLETILNHQWWDMDKQVLWCRHLIPSLLFSVITKAIQDLSHLHNLAPTAFLILMKCLEILVGIICQLHLMHQW